MQRIQKLRLFRQCTFENAKKLPENIAREVNLEEKSAREKEKMNIRESHGRTRKFLEPRFKAKIKGKSPESPKGFAQLSEIRAQLRKGKANKVYFLFSA